MSYSESTARRVSPNPVEHVLSPPIARLLADPSAKRSHFDIQDVFHKALGRGPPVSPFSTVYNPSSEPIPSSLNLVKTCVTSIETGSKGSCFHTVCRHILTALFLCQPCFQSHPASRIPRTPESRYTSPSLGMHVGLVHFLGGGAISKSLSTEVQSPYDYNKMIVVSFHLDLYATDSTEKGTTLVDSQDELSHSMTSSYRFSTVFKRMCSWDICLKINLIWAENPSREQTFSSLQQPR